MAILARGQAAIDETVASLESKGVEAIGFSVDVLEPAQIEAAFAAIDARWGSLNILVNTIGPAAGRFENLTDDDWLSGVRARDHVGGPVRACRVPLLRRAEWARIVNFAAHSIQRQSEILPAYTASKAAVASVSKNLSKSLAKEGILVNTVSPGTIVTASFTENFHDVFVERGLDSRTPTTSCDGSKRCSISLRTRAGRPRRGGRGGGRLLGLAQKRLHDGSQRQRRRGIGLRLMSGIRC